MGRFINPFTDWGFKRIFGQEFSKMLLIDFLNDLLVGERHITDVTYHDKEQLAETMDQRCMIYDIYCTTDTDERIIVEMQNKPHPYFLDRALCYASRCVIEQVKKGKKKDVAETDAKDDELAKAMGANSMNYHFLPVYTICFMNFKDNALKKFRTDVVLADRDDHRIVSDKLRFIYLTLPLFKEHEEECSTNFEKWIYVLKHMEALERMPFTSQKQVFKVLAEYADRHALNQEENERYEESLWRARENYDYYIDAIRKGRAEGRAEGSAEKERTMALSLLHNGVSPELIAKSCSLSVEEIKNLAN